VVDDSKTACLDDSTVLRFVSGQLDEPGRRAVEDEVGRCPKCAALVAELMRGSAVLPLEADDGDAPRADEPVDGAARYVLGPMIARGGMGTILAAFDRRLSRSVAVKRMEGSGRAMAARFRREIRVTASLQHPGIVPIYDAGVLDDGQPFYAMRHVPGASLEQAMAETDGDRRLGLLVPVLAAAEAVAYAHTRGIVHRDLKPSNILVGPFGETVVIDWGLAGVDDDAHDAPHDAHDPQATSDGAVIGTPRFMAPEQARGEPATPESDVYALGGILYQALAGVPPVAADSVSHVLERVARAEVRPLRDVAPGLPGDLVAIVERAMAAAPAARYPSCSELAADLRRFQTGQLVAAHRYSRGELVRRFARRHRAALVFAVLLAAVLGVGGTLSVRRIVAERERAEAGQALAQRERLGAEELVKFLLGELRTRLTTVGRLDVLSGVADRVDAYYLTTAAGRAEAPEAVRDRAALNDLRAAVAGAAGDAVSADRYLDSGLAMLAHAPDADEVRGDLVTSQARRASQTGDFAKSRALYLDAVALYRKVPPGSPAQLHSRQVKIANRLSSAATTAERLNQLADAEREWKEATAILEARLAEDPADLEAGKRLCELRMTVGQRRYRRGQLDDAEAALRAALDDGERLAARAPKDSEIAYLVAWSAISLANVRYGRGDLDGAVQLREQALGVAATMLAIEPASVQWQVVRARCESELGMVAFDRRDWAEAARQFGAAHTTHEQLVSLDPKSREHRRDAAITAAELAEAETSLGRFDAARAAWLAAIAQFGARAKGDEPEPKLDWAFALRGYAAFERQHGTPEAAGKAIAQAVELVDQTPDGKDLPVMVYYRAAALAEAATQRGAQPAATALWQRAATLLGALARKVSLEPEWAKILTQARAELARGGVKTP
jgi:tetratricopeptide (TPR) repeat protein